MGSLFSQDVPAAPAPPPVTLVRDEINNVEQVPVENADGTTTFITRQIPLSAEEQAERDELDRIANESLAEITRLSTGAFTPDATAQRAIDALEATRIDALDDTFSERTRQEENRLAQRGLGDSSAGDDVRRQRRLDRQDADVSLQRDQETLIADLRADELGRQQNLFTLATQQQDATLARESRAALSGQRVLAQQDRFRQASILDSFNAQLRQSLAPEPGDVFLSALAGSAGRALGTAF